jgi:hypothetical protein
MEALVNGAFDRIHEDFLLLYDALRAYEEVRRGERETCPPACFCLPGLSQNELLRLLFLFCLSVRSG